MTRGNNMTSRLITFTKMDEMGEVYSVHVFMKFGYKCYLDSLRGIVNMSVDVIKGNIVMEAWKMRV
jgi:hypothetical protein